MNVSQTHNDLSTSELTAADYVRGCISAVSVMAATAAVLRAMGRNWWCSCSSAVPWAWDVNSLHNSQHLFDPYSLTHVLHGVIFFIVLRAILPGITGRTRFLIAIIIESGWEILENSPLIIERYRSVTVSLGYYGDSIANSVADIFCCAVGYLIARRIGWRWSLLLFATVELFLLVTIRDCLTLNVIMLVKPIEAIKQWQMGM
jgi:hypothetical protein